MWVFICYGEKTKCNFMLLLESIHCAVTTPAGRKWCVHYIEPIRPFRWRNLTNGAEVCCLMSFLPVAVIFMRPVYIVLFYCLRGPHLPCVFVHFFFSCLSCDTTVLSGYVIYLKLFFSSITRFPVFAEVTEWRKVVLLACLYVITATIFQPTVYLYSVSGSSFQSCSFYFSCLEFSTFMRYNVFVWCLVQAEVCMHFLIMRCMTKLFTTSSFPVSQDQALYMCTPS